MDACSTKLFHVFAEAFMRSADQLMPLMKAEAYVLDWEGALYPNGVAIPFSA
jgi:hypothetical protein